MGTSTNVNRSWHLKSRPVGSLKASDFELRDSPVPQPKPGELLIRTVYLSLDPTHRLWTREKASYMPSVKLGGVMRGFILGVVEQSHNADYPAGCIVTAVLGWSLYNISDGGADGSLIAKVEMDPRLPLIARFGLFEHIGLTSYFGVLDLLRPRPRETLVVSGAAGAVGSLAVQIGKIYAGCRVVGVAGTDDKCRWLTEELGADAAVNYRKGPLAESLRAACPDGIDTFFDNVGGECLEAVLDQINMNARIAMCGAISQYGNDDKPYGPSNIYNLLMKRARIEGFIVLDYAADKRWWAKAHDDITNWHLQGRLKYRVDVVKGIDNAAGAVTKLFEGTNTGKLVVQLSEEPARR
jgi:NADPH-dependent curcumin reductase CurA